MNRLFEEFRLCTISVFQNQQRKNFATLKDISVRLRSIKNIQKITKSMKMVSAAKYARAEKELKPVRPYGIGAQAFYEKAEVSVETARPNRIVIAVTSDRGLCGGVHSAVAKAVKVDIMQNPDNTKLICIGDKSRNILSKQFGKHILFCVTDIGKKPVSFIDSVSIVQEIINSGYNFDTGKIYYNWYKSVVSYNTKDVPIHSMETFENSKKFYLYDSLDKNILSCYQEYLLASLLYYTLKESACSEQSSRMTAMDSASKNAGDMISKLTLTFNRTRQAVITRELIEIISGASAL